MAKTLKDYFPMIRTRKEVLGEIESRKDLLEEFESWKEEQQEEFLDFCTGVKGAKILYDPFFKEILSVEYHPERLEKFISRALKQKVKIRLILPNDSTRIADESTLLITDIVVELEDGSLVNVEIQKIGYAFPGERMACYSADLLLRQYKRVKGRRKKEFTYRDIKDVYLIVLFEKSSGDIRRKKDVYIHHGKMEFDTGLELNTLQKYTLIALDNFKESTYNKDIKNELDAWLTFFSCDEPERIIELLERYPEFKVMYEEIYQMCLNVEGVMHMFSEELRILDRNTVKYMIDEQEKEIKEKAKEIKKQEKEIKEKAKEIEKQEKEIKEQEKEIKDQEKEIKDQEKEIKKQEKEIDSLKAEIEALKAELLKRE